LPDGSTLKELSFWYQDGTPPDLQVEIVKIRNWFADPIIFQRVMGTPNAPTLVSFDIPDTPDDVVDNKNYHYYIRIATLVAGSGVLVDWPEEIIFYGANIGYSR